MIQKHVQKSEALIVVKYTSGFPSMDTVLKYLPVLVRYGSDLEPFLKPFTVCHSILRLEAHTAPENQSNIQNTIFNMASLFEANILYIL